MKKIILSFVLILGLMFSTAFSYNLNTKDTQLVNKINRKFDLIYKNAPKKIEDIYEKVQELLNVKFKGKENTRIYTIINALNIHLEEILNKKIDEEKGDLEKLFFGKQEKIKSLSTNNKKEIVKRLKNGEHCFILVKGQNNEIKDYCFNEELKIFLKKGGSCSKLSYDRNGYKICNEIKNGSFKEIKEIKKIKIRESFNINEIEYTIDGIYLVDNFILKFSDGDKNWNPKNNKFLVLKLNVKNLKFDKNNLNRNGNNLINIYLDGEKKDKTKINFRRDSNTSVNILGQSSNVIDYPDLKNYSWATYDIDENENIGIIFDIEEINFKNSYLNFGNKFKLNLGFLNK